MRQLDGRSFSSVSSGPGDAVEWLADDEIDRNAELLGGPTVSKSFQDWLKEGEMLYDGALTEYRRIEAQLDELEKQLAGKQTEVNQIAAIIGKEPVEGNRRLSAQIVEPNHAASGGGAPNSAAAIARAITGRGMGR